MKNMNNTPHMTWRVFEKLKEGDIIMNRLQLLPHEVLVIISQFLEGFYRRESFPKPPLRIIMSCA
jgi:hypothetical protein